MHSLLPLPCYRHLIDLYEHKSWFMVYVLSI